MRRVEVSLRNLIREDRDAFTAAKQKEWASLLDKEALELVQDRLKVPRSHILRARCVPKKHWELVKDRLKVSRSHILRARWVLTWKNVGTEKVPTARMRALGLQDPHLTTLPTSSPTLMSDGGSAILQWIVNEGTLVGKWKLEDSFFLRGDPDPAHKGSDAFNMDPTWISRGG